MKEIMVGILIGFWLFGMSVMLVPDFYNAVLDRITNASDD